MFELKFWPVHDQCGVSTLCISTNITKIKSSDYLYLSLSAIGILGVCVSSLSTYFCRKLAGKIVWVVVVGSSYKETSLGS